MNVQTVGIREFRANLHKYTRQNSHPVAITFHGEPIGYYIAVHKAPEEKDFAALIEATRKMSALLEERGVTVDEMVDEFKKARRESNQQ